MVEGQLSTRKWKDEATGQDNIQPDRIAIQFIFPMLIVGDKIVI